MSVFCEVTSNGMNHDFLYAKSYIAQMLTEKGLYQLTFGRTREHFVTIPSTQTRLPRKDEVSVRGVTCLAPKLKIKR